MVMEVMIMMVDMVEDHLLTVVRKDMDKDKTLVVEAVEPSVAVAVELVTMIQIMLWVLVVLD